MRDELEKSDNIMVSVQHFTEETIELLKIITSEFPKQLNSVINFRFGVDFKEDDLDRLETFLADDKNNILRKKRISV